MSFPIRCTECGRTMQRLDDETDCCENGACEAVGYPIPHEPDDPRPLCWTDDIGEAA